MRYPALAALCLVCCLPAAARDSEPYRRPLRDQSRELYKRAVTNYQWALQFRRLQQPGHPIYKLPEESARHWSRYRSGTLFQRDYDGVVRWSPQGYRFLHPGYGATVPGIPVRRRR